MTREERKEADILVIADLALGSTLPCVAHNNIRSDVKSGTHLFSAADSFQHSSQAL